MDWVGHFCDFVCLWNSYIFLHPRWHTLEAITGIAAEPVAIWQKKIPQKPAAAAATTTSVIPQKAPWPFGTELTPTCRNVGHVLKTLGERCDRRLRFLLLSDWQSCAWELNTTPAEPDSRPPAHRFDVFCFHICMFFLSAMCCLNPRYPQSSKFSICLCDTNAKTVPSQRWHVDK